MNEFHLQLPVVLAAQWKNNNKLLPSNCRVIKQRKERRRKRKREKKTLEKPKKRHNVLILNFNT